jgi:hypothetical protein
MRSDSIAALKMSAVVSWIATACSLVGGYKSSGGTCRLPFRKWNAASQPWRVRRIGFLSRGDPFVRWSLTGMAQRKKTPCSVKQLDVYEQYFWSARELGSLGPFRIDAATITEQFRNCMHGVPVLAIRHISPLHSWMTPVMSGFSIWSSMTSVWAVCLFNGDDVIKVIP